MSNHYHQVLRVDVDKAENWSEANVIRRWKRIYSIQPIVQQYLKNPQSEAIAAVVKDIIEKWRERLIGVRFSPNLLII